jgi:hypothetical protein
MTERRGPVAARPEPVVIVRADCRHCNTSQPSTLPAGECPYCGTELEHVTRETHKPELMPVWVWEAARG